MLWFTARGLVLLKICNLFQLCNCAPPTWVNSDHNRRSNAVSGCEQNLPLFNTTVVSADGVIGNPPKLQSKVYIRPSTTSASNITSRQIMGERRILTCKSPTATFHHSHCRHMKGVAYSIREYMTWCREPLPSNIPQPTFTLPSEARAMASSTGRDDPSLHGEYGTCHIDEICIDSLYSLDYRNGFVLIANCVKKQLFQDAGVWNDEWDNLKDIEGKEFGEEDLDDNQPSHGSVESAGEGTAEDEQKYDDWKGAKKCNTETQNGTHIQNSPSPLFLGKYASVVITQGEEGITPLEVRKIGIRSLGNMTSQLPDAARSASNQSEGDDVVEGDRLIPNDGGQGLSHQKGLLVAEQERSCTNCVDLKTFKPLAPDTTALEMEVKMVGIGSASLAGILWIALLSG